MSYNRFLNIVAVVAIATIVFSLWLIWKGTTVVELVRSILQ